MNLCVFKWCLLSNVISPPKIQSYNLYKNAVVGMIDTDTWICMNRCFNLTKLDLWFMDLNDEGGLIKYVFNWKQPDCTDKAITVEVIASCQNVLSWICIRGRRSLSPSHDNLCRKQMSSTSISCIVPLCTNKPLTNCLNMHDMRAQNTAQFIKPHSHS